MRRLLIGELRVDPLALDGDTADRLLAGRLDPADAPPGYAKVAALLAAAAGPSTPEELTGEASVLATFTAMTRPSAGSRRRAARHRGAFGSRLAALAAAALCVLLVGGVAAAATGTLPEPARRMVDSVTRAAHHQPARSALDGQDPGEVRSGGWGQDGAASVGHAGAVKAAHAGRSAPAALTGPDATGAARGGHCASNLAGRAGVDGCGDVKKAKPVRQGQQPAQSSQADTYSSSAPVTPVTGASGANHRQKEDGPPGPEGGRH